MSKEKSSAAQKLLSGDIPMDFDWDIEGHHLTKIPAMIPASVTPKQAEKTIIVAEDLRDGLHGSPEYPYASQMIKYVSALESLGINQMTVGIFSGKGNEVDKRTKQLLKAMYKDHPNVTPIVLSLATEESLSWTADCKEINPNLNAIVFMGTAPSRMLVEEWSKSYVLEKLAWAIDEAVSNYQIDVIGATEHTTQTPPNFLEEIIKVQVDKGIKVFCIADTIGIATPRGTHRIVEFTRNTLNEMGAQDVLIDWHGHRDLGNDMGNAMSAIAAGADRVHTVARGIGERAGNTPMEPVILNLTKILEKSGKTTPWKISELTNVLDMYSNMVNIPTPTHGTLGKRSHVTSLGIHTAAIYKTRMLEKEMRDLNEHEIAKRLTTMSGNIYTAVSPEKVGKVNETRVGPFSGETTVELAYLSIHGHLEGLTKEMVKMTLDYAKKAGEELSPQLLKKLLRQNNT